MELGLFDTSALGIQRPVSLLDSDKALNHHSG